MRKKIYPLFLALLLVACAQQSETNSSGFCHWNWKQAGYEWIYFFGRYRLLWKV